MISQIQTYIKNFFLDFYQQLAINTDKTLYSRKKQILLLIAIVIISLLPFINKAFHVDDPPFIWAGQHIQKDPINFYNFNINWYGYDEPMYQSAKNPPLASYYIAAVAYIVGWSEIGLHLAFLPFAILVAVGGYLIAERYCKNPFLATLTAVLTPVFFVSSLTIMSDMMMFAIFLFSIHFWLKGLESNKHVYLILSGFLIALSALTKYFGLVAVPLLLIDTILKKRKFNFKMLYLLIPIVIIFAYQKYTAILYGDGLTTEAAEFSFKIGKQLGNYSFSKIIILISFTGGCIASVLFFTLKLWSRKTFLIGSLSTLVLTIIITTLDSIGVYTMPKDGFAKFILSAQTGLWCLAGFSLIAVSFLDIKSYKNIDSLFLFLWLFGTFIFAGFINWTTNGRVILPMIIPAAIFIIRRIEMLQTNKYTPIIPLALSALLSISVLYADYNHANTIKNDVEILYEQHIPANTTVWFQGHWGFQYYMEQRGGKAVDANNINFAKGDIMIVPLNNTNIIKINPIWIKFNNIVYGKTNCYLSTLNIDIGAGLYSSIFGTTPFVFGNAVGDKYAIFTIKKSNLSP